MFAALLLFGAVTMGEVPQWAQWDRDPTALRIPAHLIGRAGLVYAQVCTIGGGCEGGSPAVPATRLTPRIEGNELVLGAAARWHVVGQDAENVFVTPALAAGDAERYFHDLRQDGDDLWFHETVRLQTGDVTTFTVYLLDGSGTAGFRPKKPVPEIGYGVAAPDFQDMMIFHDDGPFNPKDLNIVKWHHDRTIEWVVSVDTPDEYREAIFAGVNQWNDVLPKGLSVVVRMARGGEELDSPYLNPIFYAAEYSSNGESNMFFYPDTGEIFRAFMTIHVPEANVVGHEIGHTLGLRHNFKGSLFDGDIANYPAGSSIMEYAKDRTLRRVGPYDRDAIMWGYTERDVTTRYPFCAEEKLDIDPSCQTLD